MGFFDGILDDVDGNSKDNDRIVVEVVFGKGHELPFYSLVRGHDNALAFARFVEKNGLGTVCFRRPEEFDDLSFCDPWGFHKLKPKTA